jgi:hypothetical protein
VSAPVTGRVTRRHRVSFAQKDIKLHGSSIHTAEGDYEEATGILWNPVRGPGVDPNDTRAPVGIHLASGAKLQAVPAEELAKRDAVKEAAELAALEMATRPDAPQGEVIMPDEYEVAPPADDEDGERPTGLEGLPEPKPGWKAPPVKNEPVTPAAKRAAAEKAKAAQK